MVRSMASPFASEKEGTYPSRTSSPSALDSTLAEAGGAEDCHEASTRYASTSFPSALLFFSEPPSLNKFCTEWLTCVVSGTDEQLAQAIILIPGSSGKAQRSCICQKQ